MQLFVIKSGSDAVVIDTGVGNFKPRPAPSQNRLNTPTLDWLKGIGCGPEQVKHVVMTHLHGDHVGWNTVWADGRWQPTFPNATYYIPEDDWKVYHPRYAGGMQDHISGPFADSVKPVVDAGLAQFVGPGAQIAGLLEAFAAPGHSPGQLGYSLNAGGENSLFCGDVLHSPLQISFPEMNSRWCEYPDIARSTRAALLKRATQDGSLLYPAHAAGLAGWRIAVHGEGYVFDETPQAPSLGVPKKTQQVA